MKTPEAFVLARDGVLVRRGFEGYVGVWLESPDEGRSGDGGRARGAGRGGLRVVPLPEGGAAFVRRYRHGGLLRGVLRDVYWIRPPRPFRELAVTERARSAGLEAPEVLAAAALPLWGRLGPYRGVLVTRALEGRRTLADALLAAASDAERRAWIECAAQGVARLHRAGIRHPDLNVGNLLVTARPAHGVAIIDFDRAAAGRRAVGRIARAFARRRLARSVAKLGLPGFDRDAVAALVRASGGGRAP